jgi:peptidylprolyl isomerase
MIGKLYGTFGFLKRTTDVFDNILKCKTSCGMSGNFVIEYKHYNLNFSQMKKLSKREYIGVGVALIVTFGFLFFGSYIFSFLSNPASSAKSIQGASVAEANNVSTPELGGIVVRDLLSGAGDAVKTGDRISVNYIGMLPDGSKFDSSYDRREPIEFTVGSGQLIKGFDEGVLGMQVGGKRKITIPPELGYGSQQVGPIPANSTIVFDVELMKIIK